MAQAGLRLVCSRGWQWAPALASSTCNGCDYRHVHRACRLLFFFMLSLNKLGRHPRHSVCMCRSEDDPGKLVLSLHHEGSKDGTRICQAWQSLFYQLNHLNHFISPGFCIFDNSPCSLSEATLLPLGEDEERFQLGIPGPGSHFVLVPGISTSLILRS